MIPCKKLPYVFFEDVPVRALWDEESTKWWFCAMDIAEALTKSKNPRSYWNALKRRKSELSTICRQLKIKAKDGKFYLTDVVDEAGLNIIIALVPSKKSDIFARWMKNLETTLDEKSKLKAYELFETGFINSIEIGTIKGLQQIHGYIFGGLYDFAGQIRTLNIAKGGFAFAPAMYLNDRLKKIEEMPDSTIDEIISKYIEMNVAHPFMEGNGRITRIWLDMLLKAKLGVCVDWSKIDKSDYLHAMRESVTDETKISVLIKSALTDDEIIGADYSEEAKRIVNNDISEDILEWTDIVHPDDKEEALAEFMAAIRDHSCNTPYDTTYRMRDRNGEYHWFHSAGRMIRSEDGSGEFFGIHIDITKQIEEQLEVQEQLEKARALAEQANRSKTSFLFNMSHDVRTPMNAIIGFTGMAKKHIEDKEKTADYLEKIDTSGQQLLTLINQVLEMARIESGKIELDEDPVNVHEAFSSSVTVLAEQAKNNGLEFRHSLEDVTHDYILADTARMNSVTLNIVGNAMKYTPAGGRVEFRLREIPARRDGYATYVFTCADTGIGMSEEFLKTLFDPFTGEKSSTVSKIQGTGLGMSIVKEPVELMGGNIEVQSTQGKGTRFDVTLDFKIDENSDPAFRRVAEKNAVSLKGRKVLLVEDNELNSALAKLL